MINNKNTFGKIALIVVVVYILLTAIAASAAEFVFACVI